MHRFISSFITYFIVNNRHISYDVDMRGMNGSQIQFCLSDIDECALPVDPCDAVPNSVCNNTNGSYNCLCKDGFRKSGSVCKGKVII